MFFFSEYNGTQNNSCSHKAHKVPLRVTHKDHKEQPDDLAILCGLCACAALRELCGNRLLFFVVFVRAQHFVNFVGTGCSHPKSIRFHQLHSILPVIGEHIQEINTWLKRADA